MSHGHPLLWCVLGSNGAGKSTYYETRIRPILALEWVNADAIGAARWPSEQSARAYDAARLAAGRRSELIAARTSFATETVFSHPSKLEMLREAKSVGYEVFVTFVGVATSDLAVARVADRHARGGHDVPAAKVRARYERLRPLAVQAVLLADRGFVLDNSSIDVPLRDVLLYERGQPTWRARDLPAWVTSVFGLGT